MADTLTTQIAESVVEIVTATIELIPQKAPMPNLVKRYNIPKGHDRVEIPRVNATFSVQTPTEGDELVNSSQFDLTSTTIQPTRRAIMVRVDERPTYFSQDDVIKLCSNEIARAQAQDIDTDLTAEFANYTTHTDPVGTGTDLTVAGLRTAHRRLMANTVANGGPAPEPLYYVMGPIQYENLVTNLGLQGVVSSNPPWIPTGLSEELIRNYFIPQNHLVGISMFWDGYMVATGNDMETALYSRDSLWLAISKNWDMKTFEVPNWIGTILRSVADYNSGIGTFNGHGIGLLCDNT